MKTNHLIILSLCLSFIMGSCGGSVKNDPVEIAKATVDCLKKGKFKDINNFFPEGWNTDTPYDELQEAYDHPTDRNYKKADRAKSMVNAKFTLTDQKVDGDNAWVTFDKETTDLKSSIKVYLVKKDGQWYLQTVN